MFRNDSSGMSVVLTDGWVERLVFVPYPENGSVLKCSQRLFENTNGAEYGFRRCQVWECRFFGATVDRVVDPFPVFGSNCESRDNRKELETTSEGTVVFAEVPYHLESGQIVAIGDRIDIPDNAR